MDLVRLSGKLIEVDGAWRLRYICPLFDSNTVGVAQFGRAPDCGSGGRGFKSHHSPRTSTEWPLQNNWTFWTWRIYSPGFFDAPAPSSSGQDSRFSFSQQGFDSPRGHTSEQNSLPETGGCFFIPPPVKNEPLPIGV